MFQCPNCRAYTDLSAEVDDSNELYEDELEAAPQITRDQPLSEYPNDASPSGGGNAATESRSVEVEMVDVSDDERLAAVANNLALNHVESRGANENNETRRETGNPGSTHDPGQDGREYIQRSPNINIPNRSPSGQISSPTRNHLTPLQPGQSNNNNGAFEDNPLTPRNDSGPLAFDGRAGRI